MLLLLLVHLLIIFLTRPIVQDKLREETKRLMSDKESYQTAAKDGLKRLVEEKLVACKRLKEVERLGRKEH